MARARARAQRAATRARTGARRGSREACEECKKDCKALYEKYKKEMENSRNTMTPNQQADADRFARHCEANRARYESVARQTGVPAPLIGAIHWREGSGNFGTYLHQGDPLGRPAAHVPRDIPVFRKDQWEEAAAHAINRFKKCAEQMGMTENTTDRAMMAAFAERYNGMGYLYHGVGSAYASSGTSLYSGGFYPADGKWDFSAVDPRPGVLPLVDRAAPLPPLP